MSLLQRLQDRANQLKREVVALVLAYRDPRVSWLAKAVALSVAVYAFSPIDLIPDFIPVLGYLDDLILLPLGIALAIKLIPPEVMAECRARAAQMDAEGKFDGRAGALIVIALWAVAVLFVVHLLRG